MSHDPKDHLTALLDATRTGQAGANDRLTRTIYGELRRIARGLMRHERPDHTLQPSALVPEAAELLGVSDTTVEGDWRFARAWLRGRLGGSEP